MMSGLFGGNGLKQNRDEFIKLITSTCSGCSGRMAI